MKLIVLCGGMGTRLKSVVSDVPKPLAPINGIPFLALLLDNYFSIGFEDVIISAGYKSEMIEEFVNSFYPQKRIEVITELEPLGTGGAVRFVCEQNPGDEKYLVVNGDTYISNLPDVSFFKNFRKINLQFLENGSKR